MKSKDSDIPSAGCVENYEEMKNNENDESSSSESLLEIRLNEYVKKSEMSDFDLRALVVRCSSCGRQINHYSSKDVKKHRKLGVITCRECYEFYGSSEFSQDESGYNYCTWCGNGGKLIVCDYCPNGFCSACIRRNFGRAEISVTTKEGWKCYCCNRSRLKPKTKFCDLIIALKEKSLKKEKKPVSQIQKSNIPEEWLQAAFDESEEVCKNFHKKMSKLKSIRVTKKKSLKHIVKKMEDVINEHKIELKNIVTSVSKSYASHIELQMKAEQESKVVIDLTDGNGDEKNSDCIILDNSSKANDSDDISKKNLADICKQDPSGGELSDASASLLQAEDKSQEEKMQAKRLLLKSSSESDSDDNEKSSNKKESPMDISQCNGKVEDEDLKHSNSAKSDNETSTKKKTSVENIADSTAKAKRQLTFCFSSSDSESHTNQPNLDEIVNEIDEQMEIENSDLKKEMEKSLDPELDPKLKLQVNVDLIRCDHLLKEGETYMKISDGSDNEEKLDRLIDSLCKFPRNRKSTVPKAKRRSGPLNKATAKQVLLESSSSISLSSEEDEDQKQIKIKKMPMKKEMNPTDNPADSDSSSLSLGSDEEEGNEKQSKKSKSGKKVEKSDSSDDFMPVRKKKSYDPLLHAPLFSDDDKKPKEKKEKKASRKRKLLSSDDENEKKEKKSDDTSTTSSSDESSKNKKTKKRRRIKKMGSSSDEEDDNKESQDTTPGKGRKNIRKIVSQKKLAVTTKEAQLEEKERRKRIQERQKLYNKIEDLSMDGKEIITRKMVLEVDQDSKEEIVEIHPDLVCKLKPHQVNGVKFMWECTIETVKDLDKPGSGCILAHCMGLGKTLQVIAFLHTCLTNPIVNKTIKRGMIICPYNTALNWASEFEYWLESVEGDITVHQLTSVKTNYERLDILNYWFEEGGVIILSYDMFRRLSADKIPKIRANDKRKLNKCLLDPGPDIVVCDEGHVLKNEKSAISVATNKLATKRRIVLTGTPLQNNLREYHCMLSFVKPNLLGTSKEFRNRFVNPIMNGQYDDSNEYDVKLMKKRIHILHKLLEGCVQRCDYSALTKFLPPKHEFVISVKLSEVQMQMYECYLEKLTTAKRDAKIAGSTLFLDFNNLRCIWTHPYICIASHERAEFKKMFKDDDDVEEFINDETEESAATTPSSTESDDDKLIEKIKSEQKKEYKTRSKVNSESGEDEEEEEDTPEVKQWYHEFVTKEDQYKPEMSGKMVLLVEILKECEMIRDKVLLFSQSLLALDSVEDMLYKISRDFEEKDTEKDSIGTWVKGIDYFRMDGGTSADFRKSYIDMFNDPTNDRARLFIISTRAGSLGTNLVGANRVIIFDTSWNPSHDVQAIFRVYRFGQIKPVYIYRLLAQGTMEEKIYDRQVTKLSLSCRVVDEQQIDRHFSAADLAELYIFDRNSTTQRPTPMVPKDRLLAELLIRDKDWIVTYHEHDSLLQNQTEEDLTEEERQAAWTEYENEREGKGPTINSAASNFDMANLTREPDFSQDYDGKMIPDLKVIVENLFERLKTEAPEICNKPLEFKKKLLSSVYAVRQAFQEKHVKILRMKQEYCSRGTVPNAVNKYMDELSQGLKSTADYITRLSAAITSEQNKILKQQQQQMFQRAAAAQQNVFRQQMPNMMRVPRMPPSRLAYVVRGRVPMNFQQFPRFTPTQRAAFNAFVNNMKTYSRTPAPVVTEVDDNAPKAATNNNASANQQNITSTVTIEEIP